MNTLIKTAAASLIAIAATAHNAQAKDWYLGGFVGYNAASDQTSEGPSRVVDIDFDDGYALGGFVGYEYSDAIRIEAELSYRQNDADTLAFNNIDRPFTGDGTDSLSILANVYYDFENDSAITPFIGAGAGIGFLENDFAYGPAVFEDDDTAFVYQSIIGASLAVSENSELFIDGRYFAASGVDFVRTSPAD
ncbi:MAG: outer membrane beta-barrel protein, partial [Pseudomonadota bacterium]